MARKMFKASKNSFTPADVVVMPVRVSSLVKFPSPVMFTIVLGRLENSNSLLRSLLVDKESRSACRLTLD